MANRVEIGENVENALGLNVTGAQVTVRFHGGAQAPVYDAQNGGGLITQPMSTVNGKIGADSPSGAWVAVADYDLDVTFGADTLTYFWPADHTPQFVTALPAGAGTSAPEDGELAIELYDSVNGGAWLRRWRSALAAWDMVGGPPPSGNILPGTPRVRQEFYLTGANPAVQHLRYNGATWDYVGTPPMVPVTGSPLTVLDVGQANQIRAGRQLALVDFNTLAALPTVPVGLFNLGSTANLGTGGALTNKGTVTFAAGIEGVANAAAQFTGSSAQALYIADTGAADPFRIKTGTVGAWIKTAKRGTAQAAVSKWSASSATRSFYVGVGTNNAAAVAVDTGATSVILAGVSDICDDRWHWVELKADGATMTVVVDGVVENSVPFSGIMNVGASAPLNIGGFLADGATAASDPFFGRVDEAFVTADVLSEEQDRLIYAAKIVHGYASLPRLAAAGIRRRRRGATLATSDFPSQPLHLYSLTAGALTDAGSLGTALTANGTPLAVQGMDGAAGNAYNFVAASSQTLSATDTGLPAGTTSRSYGCWFRSSGAANQGFMAWGTTEASNDARIGLVGGAVFSGSGADFITAGAYNDGVAHHIVVVEDNAAIDGLKRKVYVDGRLVVTSTTLNAIVLGGANKFRIGSGVTPSNFMQGQLDEVFVWSGALTAEQVAVIYQKSGQTLAQSIVEPGRYIEAMDTTNMYIITDQVESNYQLDLAVAS